MRIEIISREHVQINDIPSNVDFVGLSLVNGKTLLNMNACFPETLGGMVVKCTNKVYALQDGTLLTAHLYQLRGKAKVLSLKEYKGFLYYDVQYGDIRIKVIV